MTPPRTAVPSHRRCRGVRGRRARGFSARRTTLTIQAAMIQSAGVVGQRLRLLLLVGPQQATLVVSTAAVAPVVMATFLQGHWRCQPSRLPFVPRELGPWRPRRRLPGESPRAPFLLEQAASCLLRTLAARCDAEMPNAECFLNRN